MGIGQTIFQRINTAGLIPPPSFNKQPQHPLWMLRQTICWVRIYWLLFQKITGIAPKISATARDTIVLKNTIWAILLQKYSIGAASSLILIPGIAKQIIMYVAIKAIMNKDSDNIFFFIWPTLLCQILVFQRIVLQVRSIIKIQNISDFGGSKPLPYDTCSWQAAHPAVHRIS